MQQRDISLVITRNRLTDPLGVLFLIRLQIPSFYDFFTEDTRGVWTKNTHLVAWNQNIESFRYFTQSNCGIQNDITLRYIIQSRH